MDLSDTFTAQGGNPFGIGTTTSNVNGASPRALMVAAPFAGGDSNLPGTKTGCSTEVKSRAHWYNPCSFAEPMGQLDPGTLICAPGAAVGTAGCRYPSGRH